MVPKILLVNPPIYDFTAYDFWLKPYGMLSAAGFLRGKADFTIFDYLDRHRQFMADRQKLESNRWGQGHFYHQKITKPACFDHIRRYYKRFALPREIFTDFLTKQKPSDFVFIQTTMTYWYQGVAEVIEDVRNFWPGAKIILGGNYTTLCKSHAEKLGANFITPAANLTPLWEYLNLKDDPHQPALWEVYKKLDVGVLKLTDGCPFKCTYCSAPKVYGGFKPRDLKRCFTELKLLHRMGAANIAFYDDALLYDADKVLTPFLNEAIASNIKVNFHTPNAINARFITPDLAELMVTAGFKTFYIGFESVSISWQKLTGSKVSSDELERAVKHLIAAGADPANIIVYQILGHPQSDAQQLESSIRFVNSLGVRGMLSDFSPIPNTIDGEYCRKWVDLDDPLLHNKTAFPITLLGLEKVDRLKHLQKQLNSKLSTNKQ